MIVCNGSLDNSLSFKSQVSFIKCSLIHECLTGTVAQLKAMLLNNLKQPVGFPPCDGLQGDFMFLCKMPSCRFLEEEKIYILFILREETKAGKGTSV